MDIAAQRFVRPQIVATHFHLYQGDRVADFGAGTGYFLPALSKAVGNEGVVYACEIQKNLVDELTILARERGLLNTEAMWCDLETPNGIKLANGMLDAGVLINTLFQLEDKKAAFAEIVRVIRPGGKLFVIDWTESFGGLGPHSEHIVSEATAKTQVEVAGFTFERNFPAGEHHYGLAFRRV